MAHLTTAQRHALKIFDSWRRGWEVPTSSLKADGVTLATLRSLEAIDCLSSDRASNGIYWTMTDVGRAALSQPEPRQ